MLSLPHFGNNCQRNRALVRWKEAATITHFSRRYRLAFRYVSMFVYLTLPSLECCAHVCHTASDHCLSVCVSEPQNIFLVLLSSRWPSYRQCADAHVQSGANISWFKGGYVECIYPLWLEVSMAQSCISSCHRNQEECNRRFLWL